MKWWHVRDRLRAMWHGWRADGWEEFWRRMRFGPAEDPEEMVGRDPDQFDVLGEWQEDLARRLGVESSDAFLDVGCGPLRFGRRAIPLLDEGWYVGTDVVPAAIREARKVLDEEDLRTHGRAPPAVLCVKEDLLDLGPVFDWVWCQSVLTHTPPDRLDGFLEMLTQNLQGGGRALVTARFTDGEEVEVSPRGTGFEYPREQLLASAREAGLSFVEELDAEHPNGQRVLLFEHPPSEAPSSA